MILNLVLYFWYSNKHNSQCKQNLSCFAWIHAMYSVHLWQNFLTLQFETLMFLYDSGITILGSVWFQQARLDIHGREWSSLNLRNLQCKKCKLSLSQSEEQFQDLFDLCYTVNTHVVRTNGASRMEQFCKIS